MLTIYPMLACRGPVISPGETALLLCLLIAWVVSLVMGVANLAFILSSTDKKSFVLRHGGFFLLYGSLAFVFLRLVDCDLSSEPFLQFLRIFLPFAIPATVIVHFLFLNRHRKKLENASMRDSD